MYLDAPDGAYALFASRVLIGRAGQCRIVLRDPHASREHACIEISPQRVVIQDLMSVNGLYVNGRRVFEPQLLYPRDRILVGTSELSVHRIDEQPRARPRRPQTQPPRAASDVTDRDEALTVLGRVATRMLGQGRPAEAEIVLGDHLGSLLEGARTGLAVSRSMCESAAQFALLLALNLRKGQWVEYTLELHYAARHPLSRATAPLLEAALRVAPNLDPGWLLARLAMMGPYAHEIVRRRDAKSGH